MKRQAISKKVRFEVFKRDKFTCAYCGATAPNVILHIDHIKPVAKGGTNNILNLITACEGCNAGKSDRELSDHSTVKKQIDQAKDIQEKREQLQMMADWIASLQSLDDETVQILEKHWYKEKANWCWNDYGKKEIKKLLKKYSMLEITQAMDVAKNNYLNDFEDQDQWGTAFHKIGGILYNNEKSKNDPILKDAFYCRAILRNRIDLRKPEWQVLNWIKELIECYGAEPVKEMCKTVTSWSQFRNEYEAMFDDED